jgi:hypothetical protein
VHTKLAERALNVRLKAVEEIIKEFKKVINRWASAKIIFSMTPFTNHETTRYLSSPRINWSHPFRNIFGAY